MNAMPMPMPMPMPMAGGGTMSTIWMPMSGQGWIGAGAGFLGMWTSMMAAMMLPSLVPALWRYRLAAARAGARLPALLTANAAAGYLLIWTLLGGAVFALGAVVVTVTMRCQALADHAPVAVGVIVLAAGALQLTRWKAHHLASCRSGCCRESLEYGRTPAASFLAAWRHGMRLAIHCSQCCAGLTAVLLVTGVMDVPAMIAVTAGITLERLAPRGERIARLIGMLVIGAGLLLTARAAGLASGR